MSSIYISPLYSTRVYVDAFRITAVRILVYTQQRYHRHVGCEIEVLSGRLYINIDILRVFFNGDWSRSRPKRVHTPYYWYSRAFSMDANNAVWNLLRSTPSGPRDTLTVVYSHINVRVRRFY